MDYAYKNQETSVWVRNVTEGLSNKWVTSEIASSNSFAVDILTCPGGCRWFQCRVRQPPIHRCKPCCQLTKMCLFAEIGQNCSVYHHVKVREEFWRRGSTRQFNGTNKLINWPGPNLQNGDVWYNLSTTKTNTRQIDRVGCIQTVSISFVENSLKIISTEHFFPTLAFCLFWFSKC